MLSQNVLTFSCYFLLIKIFGTPKEHRKSKPYHDHVFVFSIADDHVWFRNYQVCLSSYPSSLFSSFLVEIILILLTPFDPASQITVPHNESDKIARGGLDKMTLIEVCFN